MVWYGLVLVSISINNKYVIMHACIMQMADVPVVLHIFFFCV